VRQLDRLQEKIQGVLAAHAGQDIPSMNDLIDQLKSWCDKPIEGRGIMGRKRVQHHLYRLFRSVGKAMMASQEPIARLLTHKMLSELFTHQEILAFLDNNPSSRFVLSFKENYHPTQAFAEEGASLQPRKVRAQHGLFIRKDSQKTIFSFLGSRDLMSIAPTHRFFHGDAIQRIFSRDDAESLDVQTRLLQLWLSRDELPDYVDNTKFRDRLHTLMLSTKNQNLGHKLACRKLFSPETFQECPVTLDQLCYFSEFKMDLEKCLPTLSDVTRKHLMTKLGWCFEADDVYDVLSTIPILAVLYSSGDSIPDSFLMLLRRLLQRLAEFAHHHQHLFEALDRIRFSLSSEQVSKMIAWLRERDRHDIAFTGTYCKALVAFLPDLSQQIIQEVVLAGMRRLSYDSLEEHMLRYIQKLPYDSYVLILQKIAFNKSVALHFSLSLPVIPTEMFRSVTEEIKNLSDCNHTFFVFFRELSLLEVPSFFINSYLDKLCSLGSSAVDIPILQMSFKELVVIGVALSKQVSEASVTLLFNHIQASLLSCLETNYFGFSGKLGCIESEKMRFGSIYYGLIHLVPAFASCFSHDQCHTLAAQLLVIAMDKGNGIDLEQEVAALTALCDRLHFVPEVLLQYQSVHPDLLRALPVLSNYLNDKQVGDIYRLQMAKLTTRELVEGDHLKACRYLQGIASRLTEIQAHELEEAIFNSMTKIDFSVVMNPIGHLLNALIKGVTRPTDGMITFVFRMLRHRIIIDEQGCSTPDNELRFLARDYIIRMAPHLTEAQLRMIDEEKAPDQMDIGTYTFFKGITHALKLPPQGVLPEPDSEGGGAPAPR